MTDKIREEFESWIRSTGKYTAQRWMCGYAENTVNISWSGFQEGYQARANHDKERLREVRSAFDGVTAYGSVEALDAARKAIETLNQWIGEK